MSIAAACYSETSMARDKSLPFTSPVPAAVTPRVQLLGGSVELAARPPDPHLHTQS